MKGGRQNETAASLACMRQCEWIAFDGLNCNEARLPVTGEKRRQSREGIDPGKKEDEELI